MPLAPGSATEYFWRIGFQLGPGAWAGKYSCCSGSIQIGTLPGIRAGAAVAGVADLAVTKPGYATLYPGYRAELENKKERGRLSRNHWVCRSVLIKIHHNLL